MWSTKIRKSALGILLLGVIAALVMSWLASPVLFAIIAGCVVICAGVWVIWRDGWRQTSPQSLNSRGFRPGVVVLDPGLRRDIVPLVPGPIYRRAGAARRRLSASDRPPRPARPAVPAAAVAKPPRSTRARRRNDRLLPDATITLAAERQAAGIDDLFVELDLQLIGLVPVKRKVEEIGSLLLVDRA
ncbi:MAG TPA: hypothetical protein VMG13_18220, partial [Trebonia sp.]|nr:hypothetical protein [Trebonia sp.]